MDWREGIGSCKGQGVGLSSYCGTVHLPVKYVLGINYADGRHEFGWRVSEGTLVLWEGVVKGDVFVVTRISLLTIVNA